MKVSLLQEKEKLGRLEKETEETEDKERRRERGDKRSFSCLVDSLVDSKDSLRKLSLDFLVNMQLGKFVQRREMSLLLISLKLPRAVHEGE